MALTVKLMKRNILVLLTLLAVTLPASAAPKFDRLVAISGTNNVRVEAIVSGDTDLSNLELQGVIKHARTGDTLWQGSLGRANIPKGTSITLTKNISGLHPELWSTVSPTLYRLTVTAKAADQTAESSVRFGFRSMEIRNGQFYFNGRPIFLRGLAINPPGRTVPDAVGESRAFAEAYVRCLKEHNLNIFRISGDESQTWFDVCDELGILLYAGRYGAPPGTTAEGSRHLAPQDSAKSIAEYRKLWAGFASHPSIIIYLLANELPVSGQRGRAFSELLTEACAELKKWDSTRPYIGNAGYGEGREGDVCDVHRYWGWYYNSFLTYYNLRDKLVSRPLFGDPEKNQPLTFTECVGSFTGSSGEFNVIRSKQLAPRLGWIGAAEDPRAAALSYQSFMVKQATESFRRMRPLTPRLAGLMPFTILFYNWEGISSFEQMKGKPALDQIGISYQPVLLSWEMWTPQVYAGSKLRAIAHVINDDDEGRDLSGATLNCQIVSRDGRQISRTNILLPRIPYYGTWNQAITFDLPTEAATGDYSLCGNVSLSGRAPSTNWTDLFVAGVEWKTAMPGAKTPWLYDPQGQTANALKQAGIAFRPTDLVAVPSVASSLIIGEGSWDAKLTSKSSDLRRFVQNGGRVLVLRPPAEFANAKLLPGEISLLRGSATDTAYPPKTRPFAEQMNVNLERPAHPVFQGLGRSRFSLWSDYSGWDQTKPGFPKVYPVTAGFKLENSHSLTNTAILADYDRGLEGIALAEMFDGSGSVVMCGLDLAPRAGLDPVADRLLKNLVGYLNSPDGHDALPLIDQPIQWGNFPTEQGVACGSLNGLLVNCEWVPSAVDPQAKPMAPNTGSWNMAPGDQFIPHGRNPFGPYGYSTASSLRDPDSDTQAGSGFFRARIPSGKRVLVTKVNNPGKSSASLKVQVNDSPSESATPVAPGQTLEIKTPMPAGTSSVFVTYSGARTLVLLESRFE